MTHSREEAVMLTGTLLSSRAASEMDHCGLPVGPRTNNNNTHDTSTTQLDENIPTFGENEKRE